MRIFLSYILPLLLPTILYFVWAWTARRWAATTGGRPMTPSAPWVWLVLAGVLLLAASLTYTALSRGLAPGTEIIAPRLEGGRVIPAQPR